MDEAKLLRRAAGALGRKLDPDRVQVLPSGALILTDEAEPHGELVSLAARGNCAFYAGRWWVNGRALGSEAEVDRLVPKG
jgi:hypothetical protein